MSGRLLGDERRLHDVGADHSAPNLDVDPPAGLDVGREEGERDPALEHGREVAARNLAGAGTVDEHRLPLAWRLAAVDEETPQAAGDAPLPLRLQRGAAAEGPLPPADHPAQPGLERGDAGAELVAVQRQPGLQAQRVARAEAGGIDTGVEHGLPEVGCDLGRHRALDAVLARVAGAGRETWVGLPLA